MRRLSKLIVFVTTIAAVAMFAESMAFADTASDEDHFVQLINASRAAAGLAPLSVDGQLVSNARNHSAEMAAQGTIFHNAALASQITGNWVALGENVGVGPTVDDLHAAFMNSAGHRANILGDYDRVGVGEVLSGSTIYVTEVFWKTAPASAPVASAPAGAQASAAAVATVRSCRRVGRRTVCRRTVRRGARRRSARRRR